VLHGSSDEPNPLLAEALVEYGIPENWPPTHLHSLTLAPHMLTNKGKYGLKALFHLAGLEAGCSAQAAEIASAESIPKKFLDSILRDLRVAGLVTAKKGPGGGYQLGMLASEIKLGRAIRALDGPLAPIACASRTAYRPCSDCRDVESCAVRMAMLSARDAMANVLDNMTLAEMGKRSARAVRRMRRRGKAE
jgi:Rrf2 family protein